ncbi:MAG: glycosyl transferase family 36 [Candidatus Aminicenantes bacterium]|nr:glycosyl transferase family 36 [Candidatus Aminicenantes bacterium]
MTRYGRFREDGREYLITDVRTPSPWINYLHNGRYFTLISGNGGGMSYFQSPLHGRITRYRINDVPPDRPGKYIYLRDEETGAFWSATWQPVGRDAEKYRVAHGFGYTRAEAEVEGIASSAVFFVPPEDDREVWAAAVTNRSDRTRRLSLTGYVEFALGHALVDLINQCDDQHFNRVRFDEKNSALWATKTYWVTETRGTQHQENKEWDRWAFFTVNHPVSGFETLRERFLGPYRDESNPLGVETGALSSRETDYGNAVGALRTEIELAPGETKDVIFSLGVIAKTKAQTGKNAAMARYRTQAEVDAALEKIRLGWDGLFARTRAETPEPGMNVFLNHWIPYQAKVAFDVGRVASFYYWGIGRGFGFRDTAQDTIAVVISDPEKAAERIGLLARQMRLDGRVYHHFTLDGQGEFTRHCDDPLWLILGVDEYVKETGDFAILDRDEPFLDGPPGPVLDHLLAVVGFASTNVGKHGLPVFGRGDWNDTLDYIGGAEGGESVWGGMFYAAMLDRIVSLLEFRGGTAGEIRAVRDAFRKAVEDHCWDGNWYIRAYGENDRRIGSSENAAGKIFLNTQSWAVIAGLPDRARLVRALDSAREHLNCDFGPKICAPAFQDIDPKIGLITRCVRGKKENAAVFCHPVPWLIQAECLLGRGGRAADYFRTLLPDRVDSNIFIAEPYVFSQYITSDEHESPGRASHSWQTGTAAWMYRIAYDWILGVRPTYGGLMIDPCVPAGWRSFKVERVFRGCRYRVEISNPDGREHGVLEITADGRKITGNILPLSGAPECRVRVRM